MKIDLISRKTRDIVREYFVGTSLRVIEDAFGAAGIECNQDYQPRVVGQRRTLVEQHYATLDFGEADSVGRFLKICENLLLDMEDHANSPGYDHETVRGWMRRLLASLERDGYTLTAGALFRRAKTPGSLRLTELAEGLDAPYVLRQVARIEAAIEDDPRLAIGTSKELVETVCKTLLEDLGEPHDPGWDLPELVKRTRKLLKLVPDDVPDSARAAETIRRLLGNLGAVVSGLAELRNPYGSGHGPSGRAKGLQPRHARLCAFAAIGLCSFLLETHAARKPTS